MLQLGLLSWNQSSSYSGEHVCKTTNYKLNGIGARQGKIFGGLRLLFFVAYNFASRVYLSHELPQKFWGGKRRLLAVQVLQLTYPYLGFFFKWSYSMHLCCMLVRLDHRLQVLSSSNLWQKAVMCSHLWISCVSGWPVHHQTSGMETFSKEQSEHIYYIDLAKAKSEGSICVLLITENLARRRGG